MRFTMQQRSARVRRSVLVLFVLLLPGLAATQAAMAEKIPSDAHPARYGSGWECDRGYRKADGACIAVEVPPNAHLDSRGYGWRCDRGFWKVDATCAEIALPAHAYLRSNGNEWKCDRGFKRVDQSCVPVAVPENGYLDESGDSWRCERGYRRSGDSCQRLDVPAEGYLGNSGGRWECTRGYEKRNGSCIAVAVPARGFLDSSLTPETAGAATRASRSEVRTVSRADARDPASPLRSAESVALFRVRGARQTTVLAYALNRHPPTRATTWLEANHSALSTPAFRTSAAMY
jgi:hypothetical protein